MNTNINEIFNGMNTGNNFEPFINFDVTDDEVIFEVKSTYVDTFKSLIKGVYRYNYTLEKATQFYFFFAGASYYFNCTHINRDLLTSTFKIKDHTSLKKMVDKLVEKGLFKTEYKENFKLKKSVGYLYTCYFNLPFKVDETKEYKSIKFQIKINNEVRNILYKSKLCKNNFSKNISIPSIPSSSFPLLSTFSGITRTQQQEQQQVTKENSPEIKEIGYNRAIEEKLNVVYTYEDESDYMTIHRNRYAYITSVVDGEGINYGIRKDYQWGNPAKFDPEGDGRLYHAFHNYKNDSSTKGEEKRRTKNLRYKGEKIVEIWDLSNAYLTLLIGVFQSDEAFIKKIPLSELKSYKEWVLKGRAYEDIIDYFYTTENKRISRKRCKEFVNSFLNAKKKVTPEQKTILNFFEESFPNIVKVLKNYPTYVNNKGKETIRMHRDLSKVETDLITLGICRKLYEERNIETLSVHDAVYLTIKDAKTYNITKEYIQKMFLNELDNYKPVNALF